MSKRKRDHQHSSSSNGRGDFHARNKLLLQAPDFMQLAVTEPALAAFVRFNERTSTPSFNFRNPEAVRLLTTAILQQEFALRVDIPPQTLCPMVPNRLSYLLFLEDLIGERGQPVCGVDISSLADCTSKVSFVMCNPPFYSSEDEIQTSAAAKATPASQTCTGRNNELVTDGGEVAFVSRMMQESARHPFRAQWYTSMLGLKASLHKLKQELEQLDARHVRIVDLRQGRTVRWVIAWSFVDSVEEVDPPSTPVLTKRYTIDVSSTTKLDSLVRAWQAMLSSPDKLDAAVTGDGDETSWQGKLTMYKNGAVDPADSIALSNWSCTTLYPRRPTISS
ncbi:hypothetical protein RI367_006538 [Sorochytrium milnesiophthora]